MTPDRDNLSLLTISGESKQTAHLTYQQSNTLAGKWQLKEPTRTAATVCPTGKATMKKRTNYVHHLTKHRKGTRGHDLPREDGNETHRQK